ncbi:zinc finger protein [Macleaya cordata]|uniref:RING-type E3 ubiquitin transferase n=1 Tax=Macleaya cordata TaxID=56857 RepID=A0A200QFP0_MACCD|nr:zinc finger protein [Macleaya cordata]
MGANCCRPIQDDENQSKPTSRTSSNKISFHLQSSRSGRRTPARRSGNRNLSSSSSNRDGRSVTRRLQTGQLRRPQKINAVQTQQQHLSPVTASGSSNQAYEPPHVLKSNNDKNPASDCKIETPPEVPKEPKRSNSLHLLPITNDDDFCPTCLEGYEKDNPKIFTKCKHHYHLACILEWMERSNTCPICDQEMIIEDAADTNVVS